MQKDTDHIVIKAERLSKYYRLGVINNGTLFRDMQTWWALKRGKPDPHSRIGQNKYDPNVQGFWALRDLDFEILQGDRIGIIGKNGAGKSTLLKILSRITAPTLGNIKMKGRVASLLEVGTGFHLELTGRENIYINGAILGMKRREVTSKLDEIISFSEIEQHIDTPVKRYSSGMYVRLAFAVAAHLDCEILIADEVLAVGDAAFQKKAIGKMNDLSTGQGKTVLFVSHQMNAVKNLCTKGMVLERGRITYNGDILGAIDAYNGGQNSQQKNVLEWQNDGSLSHVSFTPQSIRITERDGSAVIEPINAAKQYLMELEFDVAIPASNLTYEFFFYSEDNSPIFSASPFNSIENYIAHKGRNKVSFVIPANLLNDRKYRIELQASLFCQEWICEPGQSAPNLWMTVEQKTTYTPFMRRSAEKIYPGIEWHVDD